MRNGGGDRRADSEPPACQFDGPAFLKGLVVLGGRSGGTLMGHDDVGTVLLRILRGSLIFSKEYIIEKPAELGIGVGSIGIRDDPSGTIVTLDGIDDGHVLRIAGPFEPIVFHDGQFVSRKDFLAVDAPELLIEKFEIRSKSPLP